MLEFEKNRYTIKLIIELKMPRLITTISALKRLREKNNKNKKAINKISDKTITTQI